MRILLVAPFLPDQSASHGGGTYLGTLCEGLAKQADLGVVALARGTGPEPQGNFAFRALAPYLGDPAGQRSGSHRRRMLWQWGARGLPLIVAKHWQPALPGLLRRALDEFQPDAVLVEQAAMAQYLPWLASARTVLTDHEAGIPDQACTGLGGWADRRDLRLWRRYVQRCYPLADQIQALTSQDADILHRELGRTVLLRRPVVPVPETPVQPGAAPPRVLFLGDYRHHPNPEAARVLAREVLPVLRQAMPEMELILAGPNHERIAELAAVPGVRITGFASDLRALLGSARCLLAPLYSGGGIRMKALTALAHGLPVVTNALGARGADAPPPARTIAETTAELVAATLRLLRDPGLAARAGALAHDWARQHLAPAVVARDQIERLRQPRPEPVAAPANLAPAPVPR